MKDRCDQCRYYSKRGALTAHILDSHSGNEPSEQKHVESMVVDKSKDNEKIKVKKEHRGTACSICKIDIPRGGLTKHVKEIHPERELIKCEICAYEFLHKSSLEKHIGSTHASKLKCTYCMKDVKHMGKHIEKFHKDAPEIEQCPKCSFTSYDKTKISNHIRKNHESNRGNCLECKKRVRHIKNHMKKHKMNKFKCIPCNKNFGLKRDLCRHILYEHEKRRSYCETCGKNSVTNLRSHMKYKHPEVESNVEDDERLQRDRISKELGDAMHYNG